MRHVRGLAAALGLAAMPLNTEPAFAFKIVEPAEGATLAPGVTVNARVDLGKDSGIVTVRYYWYGEQDEALVAGASQTQPAAHAKDAAAVPSEPAAKK